MQSKQIKEKPLLTGRNAAFAVLVVLFATLVVMAFPDAMAGKPNEAECVNGATDCIVDKSRPNSYLLWAGVYLCSLFGLMLMTFKSFREKKGPTLYIGIASAAALNTLMWMALVYVGAFLINLF